MAEQVALMILPQDQGRNQRRPPLKRWSPTRLGPQAALPQPAREPRPTPELGHEPLAAASPGLISTRDGLAWDPEALSAYKWESAGHS
jgi:predicted dienelactone hydrolase